MLTEYNLYRKLKHMKLLKENTCYGIIGCYCNFGSNNVHLNNGDPYYSRICLIKLIFVYQQNILRF